MTDDATSKSQISRMLPIEAWMSVPFIVIGVLVLVQWWMMPEPSTVPVDWKYYSTYEAMHDIGPILGGGALAIGSLNTIRVACLIYETRGESA